jgi:hypothetical protein
MYVAKHSHNFAHSCTMFPRRSETSQEFNSPEYSKTSLNITGEKNFPSHFNILAGQFCSEFTSPHISFCTDLGLCNISHGR